MSLDTRVIETQNGSRIDGSSESTPGNVIVTRAVIIRALSASGSRTEPILVTVPVRRAMIPSAASRMPMRIMTPIAPYRQPGLCDADRSSRMNGVTRTSRNTVMRFGQDMEAPERPFRAEGKRARAGSQQVLQGLRGG